MKIGYILNTYPSPSHSFIRREIQALERCGLSIRRIAMRPFDGALVDPADEAEAGRTEHVLAHGAWRLLWSVFLTGLSTPLRLYAVLWQALRLGWRSEAGVLRHLIYFVEAAHVARRARALKLDRLHAHFGTNAATVAMLAHRLGAPPFSFTVHGPEEFDKPGAIALAEKLQRADFVVAISAFGRSQLCRWAPAEAWGRFHVVPCGIETGRFADPAPLPPGRPLRLVCIGRFAEQKGQLLLIEAIASLVRQGVELELALIGDGEMRPLIEESIARHALGEHIRLTGWLDEAALRAKLDAAHGLVLPSFAEGLPMVVMEAMAAARPVIATWVAGIPELMRHGMTGWLVPAGDAEALCEAITDMAMASDEVLSRMGKTARARALTSHDIDVSAQKLAGLFARPVRSESD